MSEPTEASPNQERTLTVKGQGLVSADPDLVLLFFNVGGRDLSYAASVEKLNGRVESLRRDLETVNVKRAQLKTTDFRVRADYDYNDRGRVFKGYVASHSLRLELPLDRGLLNRALAQVARSASEATVNISFDVSDKESLQQRALRAVVENARDSARVLADAAGVALGEITRIDHGFVEVRVRSRSVACELAEASAEVPPPDIEPEALDAEENVTVVWKIT